MALKRLNPSIAYLLLCGVTRLCRTLHFTVVAVYYVTIVGLDPFQLMLVGTTLMIVILLSEVPTGVVADVYSRRLSVIIGTALIGVGFVLEGALPHFAAVLTAQVIWGVGATCTSGALEAWIADELAGQELAPVYVRGAQFGQIGALVGIGSSVALASIRLNVPMLVAGIALVVFAGCLVLIMPEHGFTPAPHAHRTSRQMALQTWRDGVRLVRQQPGLMTIMGITLFFGMASETFDRLWEVHFLRYFAFPALGQLEPIVWFGIINAGTQLLSLGAAEMIRHRSTIASRQGIVRTLAGITTLLMGSVIVFGLAESFVVALIAYWSAALLRQTYEPLYVAWLNQRLEARVRATVNSCASQVDAIGQIAGGPPFGLLATAASLRVAMVAAALVLTPALALYWRSARHLASAHEVR
jgi:DHA3 family tetracycline resistance protein-like MFS transporter